MASMQKSKVDGTTYYSIVECRRINGKPTPITIQYLGTIGKILEKYNNQNENNNQYKSYSYGAVYALWKMAEKHNIIIQLDEVFPKLAKDCTCQVCSTCYK